MLGVFINTLPLRTDVPADSTVLRFLRALQERSVRPVGGSAEVPFDVRVVAATNRDIETACKEGHFRPDLYDRLNVLPLHLSPLRARRDDIPLLARHFLALATQANDRAGMSLSEAGLAALVAYSFPGNVRELRNEVARAVSLGIDQHRGDAPLPAPSAAVGAEVDLNELLFTGRERVAEAYERAYLERALQKTGGNVSRAAELAGVNRKFIQRAMKRFGLRGDTDPEPSR